VKAHSAGDAQAARFEKVWEEGVVKLEERERGKMLERVKVLKMSMFPFSLLSLPDGW